MFIAKLESLVVLSICVIYSYTYDWSIIGVTYIAISTIKYTYVFGSIYYVMVHFMDNAIYEIAENGSEHRIQWLIHGMFHLSS